MDMNVDSLKITPENIYGLIGIAFGRLEFRNGLDNMRRRARGLQGELELISKKGKTIISCRIPIKHQKDEQIAETDYCRRQSVPDQGDSR